VYQFCDYVHLAYEHGVTPGRDHLGTSSDVERDRGDRERGVPTSDPRDVGATVDPARAWAAAGEVTPDDVSGDLEATDDGEAFRCPHTGEPVDVVRAVALDAGVIDEPGEPLTEQYPEAYQLAREQYDAPLPKYYTTTDIVAEVQAVFDLFRDGEVTFFDIDRDAMNSTVTGRGDDVSGVAVRTLDPAWRESESGESVLVYDSGNVWDADTDTTLDVLRFVALDAGVIDEPSDPLPLGDPYDDSDETSPFIEAYNLARNQYDAPLPRWVPAKDGDYDATAHLPPAEELLDARDVDGVDSDELEATRQRVEELIAEVTGSAGTPTVVNDLPATGKTTGTIKRARERPLSYLAPRIELQKQALDKADNWNVDAVVLPVFSDERVRGDVLDAAVSHVRERGAGRLCDRWAIFEHVADALDTDADALDVFQEADDDSAEIDRPTCETADGKHGEAWALAVHVARELGYTPREIHTQARGLFGGSLPCGCDEHGDESGTCEYTDGWDVVADADEPPQLLVGSYGHAHVESVRTVYERASDGTTTRRERPVVFDEFPGEAFTREFGTEAVDFATWLAGCLRAEIDDRRDMFDAALWGDDWVRGWLADDDETAHPAVTETADALAATVDVRDARDAADEILDDVDDSLLRDLGLFGALETARDGDAVEAFDELASALADVNPEHPGSGVARWAGDDVLEPLDDATAAGTRAPDVANAPVDELPVGGDLAALVSDAVEKVTDGGEAVTETVRAAVAALRGGPRGCRRLAAWATDGYAHPEAHHLLRAVITPTGDDEPGDRLETDGWAFDPDATDGTTVDRVESTENATVLFDRNGHGARLHTPPERTAGSGEQTPVVGLDATARETLWSVALGEPVDVRGVHSTDDERAAFLEGALDLRVIRAADRPRFYEGDPSGKDLDGDVELLEQLGEEYGGIDAPRQRGDEPTTVGSPAAITTKGVRDVLESDDRLGDTVAAWEHYGNLTGANHLGEHRLAALLGCQHYGDDAIERFAALAGEEVDTERDGDRGSALDYGGDVATEYLAHMTEDQVMQAVLRFARGDSGATVVCRTSALADDLPVVGEAQVAQTWSEVATRITQRARRLGEQFTRADVADAVDASDRHVRRVLAELVDAGYLCRLDGGDGVATVYGFDTEARAAEWQLPERADAVADAPGQSDLSKTYTWNVRVYRGDPPAPPSRSPEQTNNIPAPPAPSTSAGLEPPG